MDDVPDELVGNWVLDPSGRVVADEVETQIREIIHHRLKRLADRDGGWTVLHVDPSDQSYWELTFPQGEMHGGGPAKLTRLRTEQIRAFYPALGSESGAESER